MTTREGVTISGGQCIVRTLSLTLVVNTTCYARRVFPSSALLEPFSSSQASTCLERQRCIACPAQTHEFFYRINSRRRQSCLWFDGGIYIHHPAAGEYPGGPVRQRCSVEGAAQEVPLGRRCAIRAPKSESHFRALWRRPLCSPLGPSHSTSPT
jgi:hypothetical protein